MKEAVNFKEVLKEERKTFTRRETLEYLRTTKMVLGEEVIQECLDKGCKQMSKKYYYEDRPHTPVMRFEISEKLFGILANNSKKKKAGVR